MRMSNMPLAGRLMASIPPNRSAVRAIFRQIGLGQALASGRISAEEIDWFLSLLKDTHTMRNELDSTPPIFRPFGGANGAALLPADLLDRVVAPVFFLWGESDPFGREEIARAFASRLPNASLELRPGGHALWMDDPEGAAERASAFLAGEP